MRRILIKNARRKGRLKRRGDLKRQELNENASAVGPQNIDDRIVLDEALTKLADEDPDLVGWSNCGISPG